MNHGVVSRCVYTCSQLINRHLIIIFNFIFYRSMEPVFRFIKFNDIIKVTAINNPHLDFYISGQEVS